MELRPVHSDEILPKLKVLGMVCAPAYGDMKG